MTVPVGIITPERFWVLTPYEIDVVAEGYVAQRTDCERDLTALAWMTATLYRAKKIPDIDKLLGKVGQKRPAKQQATNEDVARAAKAKGLKGPWD